MHPLTTISRARLASAALVAGVAAFAVPAAANAAVTTSLNGNTVTFTSDDAADNITLGTDAATGKLTQIVGANAITDFDANTAGEQSVQANQATVLVRAGGGNDTINLSAANIAAADIDGGDGDDIITGSPVAEPIAGGNGNDRITGFRGNDAVKGGAGNDTMIWNNGDGNDTNDGEDGVDEVLITAGTADDNMRVTAPTPGRILFDRVNAPFSVDMATVEKLTVTSFSGNDTLTTAAGIALPMSVDAGAGNDAISTGDGNDTILGGDDNDTLNGGAGGDRLVGERGADTMNGGAGDDTLVWNNGDGSDVMNGDDGTDRIEDNLGAADDVSSLKPVGGRVRYDRTNAPFSLDVGSSEVFELNTFGGNDSLTTAPGLPIAVLGDAGPGNDAFQGGDENDTFFGGPGDDALTTGAGNDTADGGDGNDTLSIRDGAADLARGGAGTDKAIADAKSIDAVAADVESVDRAAEPGATLPKLTAKVNVRKGVASLKLSCPAGSSGCKGTVTLRTSKGKKVTIGKKAYDLKAGEKKTLKVKLSKNAAKLAKKKKLVVAASVTGSKKTIKLTLRF